MLRSFFQSCLVTVLSLSVVACGGRKESPAPVTASTVSQLQGSYVISATGTDPSDGDYFVAGSVNFDGKGGVTGVEDLNLGSGIDNGVIVTGSYQVNSSGFAVVTISPGGGGAPTVFSFPLPVGTSKVQILYDGTGSGTLQSQNATGFSNLGNFSFTLSGEGQNTVSASGSFVTGSTGVFTSGSENYADGPLIENTTALSGFLGPALGGGRGQAAISGNNFSYYVISPTQIILAGLDQSVLLQGAAQKK